MKSNQEGMDAIQGEDGRGMDEEDEEEPPEDEEDDAFQWDPSEYKSVTSSTVRKYFIPTLNFKAETYPELIDWEEANLTEPSFDFGSQ